MREKEIDRIRRRVRELLNIIEIKFYVSKKNDMELIFDILDYPYRLLSANDILNDNLEPNVSFIERIYRSDSIILDSGFSNKQINNKHILKVAELVQPTFIVPKDYIGNNKKTTQSIYEFLELKESYNVNNCNMLLPLQKPHIIDPGLMDYDYFAIGVGLGLHTNVRKDIFSKVLDRYPDKMFHLFGTKLSSMVDLFKSKENIESIDISITNKLSYSRYINRGTYAYLTEPFYVMFYLLNELVWYYNKKTTIIQGKCIF